MGLFDSAASLFSTKPAPAAAPTPMAQQNPGAAAPVPPSGQALPNPQEVPNPLDAFSEMWKMDPNAPAPVDPLAGPLFNSNPQAIQAAAAKMDIAGAVAPELLAKAMSGQDPAAFMQVLNTVAQRAVATATQISSATTEQAHQRNNERMLKALPQKVTDIQLSQTQSENPVFNHPGAAPMLNMVRNQIKMKNPGMSPVEINKQAEAALTAFASATVAPAQQAAQQQEQLAAGEYDWSNFA